MKIINKYFLIILLSILFINSGCDKDDSDIQWGNSKIYMPQASLLDGGLSHRYPVPFNSDWVAKNYTYDSTTQVINVVLGVYRSGLQDLEPFSVDVFVDENTSAQEAENTGRGVVLPKELYSLPNKVNVEKGERETIFFLTVDLKKLQEIYPAYATRRLVLTVGISNPSKYELNEALSKTTIVVNTSSFLDPPELIKGGDMEAGSEDFWTVLHLIPNDQGVIEIKDGKMIFRNTVTWWAEANTLVYQPIEVEAGIRYKLQAEFTSTGMWDSQFEMYINKEKPVELQAYDHKFGEQDIFGYVDHWGPAGAPGFGSHVSGQFPQLAFWKKDLSADGIFTSPVDGTIYISFKILCWGNVGTITIDNVSIKEL